MHSSKPNNPPHLPRLNRTSNNHFFFFFHFKSLSQIQFEILNDSKFLNSLLFSLGKIPIVSRLNMHEQEEKKKDNNDITKRITTTNVKKTYISYTLSKQDYTIEMQINNIGLPKYEQLKFKLTVKTKRPHLGTRLSYPTSTF